MNYNYRIDWDFPSGYRTVHAWKDEPHLQVGQAPTTLCGIRKSKRWEGIVFASDPRCPICSKLARELIAIKAEAIARAEGRT